MKDAKRQRMVRCVDFHGDMAGHNLLKSYVIISESRLLRSDIIFGK